MSIFRAYDIRGVYPNELNEESALKIGHACGLWFKNRSQSPKIAVGGDTRNTTHILRRALINGLIKSGVNVVDVGTVTTPMLYFSVYNYGLNGGIQITASHNPPEWNGFKICKEEAITISDSTGIKEIEELTKHPIQNRNGSVSEKNIENDYINFILSAVRIEKPIKVVIDAGNSVNGLFAPHIFTKAGCEVVKLYCEPDGNFPNHIPNPEDKSNMKDLQKKVLETGADLGIAYDGDGDRVGFVDEKGKIIPGTCVFVALIKELVKPGDKVVYDIACSSMIEETIKSLGGIGVVSRTGHSFIHEKNKEVEAIVSGEASGHYYFKTTHFCEDAFFASLKIAEIMSKNDMKASDLIIPMYKYEMRKVPMENRFEFVENLKNKFSEKYKILTIDGVKIFLENGWILVRPSNTEPIVKIIWEGKTEEDFNKLKTFVKENIYSNV